MTLQEAIDGADADGVVRFGRWEIFAHQKARVRRRVTLLLDQTAIIGCNFECADRSCGLNIDGDGMFCGCALLYPFAGTAADLTKDI